MSATCPRTEFGRLAPAHGFSLLELLIVLVLLGLMAALAGPSLHRTYERLVASSERDEVLRQLSQLPLRVRARGKAVVLPDRSDALGAWLDLPTGWRVHTISPLRIELSGYCHGGRLRLSGPGQVLEVGLRAPYCETENAP